MAGRKPKEKLDFYNMEDGWIHDYKVRRFVKKASFAGLGFYAYLLHEVYHNSYYIEDADDFVFSASDYGNVDEEQIVEWLRQMESVELIRLIEHRGKKIITSKGIQKRYLFIRKSLRRAQEFVPEIEIWLLDCDENSISATNLQQKLDSCNNSATEIEFLHTETERETEKERERETERKQKQKKETEKVSSDFSDSSDSFHSSFSDLGMFGDPLYLSRALEEACGGKLPKNTQRKMGEWLRDYDHRSIGEAYNLAVTKGAHSIVGYMDTVLRKWSLGDGSPKWIEQEEQKLKEEKDGHMQPGKTKEIMELVRNG